MLITDSHAYICYTCAVFACRFIGIGGGFGKLNARDLCMLGMLQEAIMSLIILYLFF